MSAVPIAVDFWRNINNAPEIDTKMTALSQGFRRENREKILPDPSLRHPAATDTGL